MGLSVSDKLAFIREYKKQGGKGNYLSAIKQYEFGGKKEEVSTSIPYQAPTSAQVWQSTLPQVRQNTIPQQSIIQPKPLNFNYQPNIQQDNIPKKPLVYDTNPKNKESNQTQLDKYGITQDQEQSTNIIKDRLYNNLKPVGYSNPIERVFDAVIKNERFPGVLSKERTDAYNLYMGHPQKYNTFKISNYKPSKSINNSIYYSIPNNELEEQVLRIKLKEGKRVINDDGAGVMGHYTVSEGEDEKGKYRSYYDKWDIAPIDFGKPMEIYDRIYYDTILIEGTNKYRKVKKQIK